MARASHNFTQLSTPPGKDPAQDLENIASQTQLGTYVPALLGYESRIAN